ncbi:unnamed protein product [Candida verbasci]|uniref:Prefoldin subunit 3 n=1 Tax=Candida verbasci TaxID=1227364 RepID=A0A9W4TXE4_9ASCO|nr:unnamed protein product [Candida verbasci]
MAEILKPKKSNPRGIPEAPFIDKVENIIKDPENEFESIMSMFQQRLQQYKYMELSKKQQLADLNIKIPDIEKNLDVINYIKESKDEDEITINYELNDTLYNKATLDSKNLNSVYLWLGAEVMLEYSLDDAIELLNDRLMKNEQQLTIIKEDLEFLRENITTMEVNTARLYNWDVERRKRERK